MMEFEWHDMDRIIPNPWNPNIQTPEMFDNTVASICSEGFIDPVTVRTIEPEYDMQILDGEHRWKALIFIRDHDEDLPEDVGNLYDENETLRKMIEENQIPAINLGEMDEDSARRVTLQLNGIHGEDVPERLKDVIETLRENSSLEDLASRLPMTQSKLAAVLADLQKSKPQSSRGAEEGNAEEWVTYQFLIPPDAKHIIDSEMERIADILGYDPLELTNVQRGLVLEKICVLSADTPTESLL